MDVRQADASVDAATRDTALIRETRVYIRVEGIDDTTVTFAGQARPSVHGAVFTARPPVTEPRVSVRLERRGRSFDLSCDWSREAAYLRIPNGVPYIEVVLYVRRDTTTGRCQLELDDFRHPTINMSGEPLPFDSRCPELFE